MEKKEMSFIEKFQKASDELEKEKKEDDAMFMIAVEADKEQVCATINGPAYKISSLIAYAALRDNKFEEILSNSVKAIEEIRKRNNKQRL